MNRRHFLSALGAGALAPPFVFAENDTNRARAAAFNAVADANPWIAPIRGVTADLHTPRLKVRGKLPAELRGRFYRNGPARFERNGERYAHWFDGDGMVQQFTFTGSAVAHRGRFVRTAKYAREEAAGRFLVPAFGTRIDSAERISGPDAMNTANTNVIEHAGRVLALWEGGSAWELDARTLDSRGAVAWRDDWLQMPFSAHPKLDARGHLWNFGVMGKTLAAYHVKPDGTPGKLQIAPLPMASAMVHDAAITERYLVVPLPPLRLDMARVQGGSSFADAIRWAADEPLRWLVAPKDDVTQQRIFETPAQMVFHVGNAHETRDGHIELSYVGAPSGAFLLDEAAALMRGDATVSLVQPQTMRVRLDLASGAAARDAFDDVTEFPRVDPRFVGARARYLVSPAHWREYPGRPRLWFHGVQLRDMDTGELQRFDYGRDAIAEEHLIVARPGTARELDGWIIGTTYDTRMQATRLNVFDARRIDAGPIAVAELPYGLPLGFHGSFTAA